MSNTKPQIYTLPEPYQGFIRLDSIFFACAYERDGNIKDRVVIRYAMDRARTNDFIIYRDTYEAACSIANDIRRKVEDLA